MQNIPLITWDSDPLTEDELAKVEAAIGELPDDYRQFLLLRNGGRTRGNEVEFPDPDDPDNKFGVTSFKVVDPNFPPTVLTTTVRRKVCRFMQIAEWHDTVFLMLLNGPDAGTVYHWNWILEELWDAQNAGRKYLPKAASLRKLAPSFTEFVNALIQASDDPPKLGEMDRSVENFAKFGDHFYEDAKAFFDKMSVEELNESWPMEGEYSMPTIAYAASWCQVRVCKYLIDRGVSIHGESTFTRCRSNFEIAKMFIQVGATEEQLRELLLEAAIGIAATSVAEEHHKLIMHLVGLGIQPDFDDPNVLAAWASGVRGIHPKKCSRSY